MKKVFMLLIYLAITLVLYGGYKIVVEGDVRNAESPFPLAESLAVEDYYLVADRGPIWPFGWPKARMPIPLSHLAPSNTSLLGEQCWPNLPAERKDSRVIIIHKCPQFIEILNYAGKLPTNFTKIGAGIISYQPHYTLSIKEKQQDKIPAHGGVINHEEHSNNPRKRMQRIRAP